MIYEDTPLHRRQCAARGVLEHRPCRRQRHATEQHDEMIDWHAILEILD